MTKEPSSGISILVMGVLLSTACEQTLRTGKVGNTRNAPNPGWNVCNGVDRLWKWRLCAMPGSSERPGTLRVL